MKRLVYSLLFFCLMLPRDLGSRNIFGIDQTLETIDIYDRLVQLNIYRRLGYSTHELYLISAYIETSARHYNINQYVMIALFDIESKLGTQKLRWTRGKATDFGWGQLHIQHLGKGSIYDPVKLLNDDQYSIEAAFVFMADIKARYGKKEKDYFSRYHSFTPKHRQKYKRWLMNSLALIGVRELKPDFQKITFDPPLCNFPKGGSL